MWQGGHFAEGIFSFIEDDGPLRKTLTVRCWFFKSIKVNTYKITLSYTIQSKGTISINVAWLKSISLRPQVFLDGTKDSATAPLRKLTKDMILVGLNKIALKISNCLPLSVKSEKVYQPKNIPKYP